MTLRRFKTVALLLCAACLALAGWMLFHSLTGARMVGCGAGSGCDSVMGSPWAYVLGSIPVSLPAAVSYLLIALCILFLGGETEEDRSLDRFLWPLMLILAGALVGAALWFSYLQLFVLHAFCKYCTLLHLLGCVLAVLIVCHSGLDSSPHSGLDPESPLKARIESQWGSLAAFQAAFVTAGATLFGSGWVWLQADADGALTIGQYPGADNPAAHGLKPLLTFDVWEHAYYLDYQNRRPAHLDALWGIVDWSVVEERFGR